jgi:phytoene/squalene synthetase
MITSNRKDTAACARNITWEGSKQTYFTARLMVDKELVDDFFRAYAYFRWMDDIIDNSNQPEDERSSFIKRQRELIDRLYDNQKPEDLLPQEEILADLIRNDRGENSGLQSFIRNMFAMIEFDAYRKGQLINTGQLDWYLGTLSKSVTDGLLYFIGNHQAYPETDDRYLAATAAHIVHLLRDMSQDIADGFINIPSEFLDQCDLSPKDMENPQYRAWVQKRVELAREYFREGKSFLDKLDVLRCKIVGYWYCARFEGVLDTIERDGYVLRAEYHERQKISTWLRMVWISFSLTLRHLAQRGLRTFFRDERNIGLTEPTKEK